MGLNKRRMEDLITGLTRRTVLFILPPQKGISQMEHNPYDHCISQRLKALIIDKMRENDLTSV